MAANECSKEVRSGQEAFEQPRNSFSAEDLARALASLQPAERAIVMGIPELVEPVIEAPEPVHQQPVTQRSSTLLVQMPDTADNSGGLDWRQKGTCAQTDADTFFPEKGSSVREGKKICVGCEVAAQCLQYALEHNEKYGVWGGLSRQQRIKLRRESAA